MPCEGGAARGGCVSRCVSAGASSVCAWAHASSHNQCPLPGGCSSQAAHLVGALLRCLSRALPHAAQRRPLCCQLAVHLGHISRQATTHQARAHLIIPDSSQRQQQQWWWLSEPPTQSNTSTATAASVTRWGQCCCRCPGPGTSPQLAGCQLVVTRGHVPGQPRQVTCSPSLTNGCSGRQLQVQVRRQHSLHSSSSSGSRSRSSSRTHSRKQA
jgi:hypothetical protein